MKTILYTINLNYLPRHWKTEHTDKYISKEKQLQLVHKKTHNNNNKTQQRIPFFLYKIR